MNRNFGRKLDGARRRLVMLAVALGLGLFSASARSADASMGGVSTTASPAPAALTTNLPLLGETQWTGFVQNWSTLGEETGKGPHSYVLAGDYLKHFQVGFTSNPYSGVSLVMLSEVGGQSVSGTGAAYGATYGLTLLNGYMTVDLSRYTGAAALPLTLTAGQFKTHFGLNRMARPDQLTLVDYSSIYNGATGVMGTSTYWDDGMMLAWQHGDLLEADAAWVNGQGPNLQAPSAIVLGQPDQDFTGNVTVSPCRPLKLGVSYLYGELFSSPGVVGFPNHPKGFTDEYARFALPGKSFAAEVEFLNRAGSGHAYTGGVTDEPDRNGLTVTLSQYLCDPLQLVFGYDHVTVYGAALSDTTRYLGGLSWYPVGRTRFSLEQEASASGSSERASSSRTILESQVSF